MKISVIIATMNRAKDLKIALDSVARQTLRPCEILIVDQSTDGETRRVSEEFAKKFSGLDVPLHYVYQEEKALVKARNRGIGLAKGDLISFLDDDAELFPDYYEKVVKYFEKDPGLGGLSGNVQLDETMKLTGWKWLLRKSLWKIFLLNNLDGRMTASGFGYPIYEREIDRVTPVEMLHGCNMNVRSHCIPDFTFDEWFTGYSYREDAEFTYRVFLGTKDLLMVPDAKLYHHQSPSNRMDLENLRRMQIRNYYYMFKKFKYRGFFSMILFYYSLMGTLLIDLIEYLTNRDHRKYTKLRGGVTEAFTVAGSDAR